jgi:hypothetical protein
VHHLAPRKQIKPESRPQIPCERRRRSEGTQAKVPGKGSFGYQKSSGIVEAGVLTVGCFARRAATEVPRRNGLAVAFVRISEERAVRIVGLAQLKHRFKTRAQCALTEQLRRYARLNGLG